MASLWESGKDLKDTKDFKDQESAAVDVLDFLGVLEVLGRGPVYTTPPGEGKPTAAAFLLKTERRKSLWVRSIPAAA